APCERIHGAPKNSRLGGTPYRCRGCRRQRHRGTTFARSRAEEIMFKRILVPLDFSPPSDAALEYALRVAGQYGASLHLLHVAEDPYRAFYSAEVFVPEIEGLRDSILEDATRRMKDRLRTTERDEGAVTVSAIIGTPAGSIVEYAGGNDIDLIVMG